MGVNEFSVQFVQTFCKLKSISKILTYKLSTKLITEDRDRFKVIVHLPHELGNSLRVFTTNKQSKKNHVMYCWRNNYDD